jgi:hypothetical protein
LKPSSLPRSEAVVLSDSTAVAATKEKFQPRPRPNSAMPTTNTPVSHSRLIVEAAISSRPPASARVRPKRSTRSPTTTIRPNIPITCAPMIGKTFEAPWW